MIKIYSTSWCPFCAAARRLLTERKLEFEEVDIEEQGIDRSGLEKITGGRTVPQIVINDKPIGGYENLMALDAAGKLTA